MTTPVSAPTDSAPPVSAPTASSPTARHLWTRSRGLLVAVVVLGIAGVVLAALRSGEQHGRLDPRSADRYGSRAVSKLLADRGVTTRVVTTARAAAAASGPGTTVLVSDPDRLTPHQQSTLHDALTGSGGRTVLVAPDTTSVGTLAPGVSAASPIGVTARAPKCSLPAAVRAGAAELGGIRYKSSTAGADTCYPGEDLPTLLRLPGANGSDTVLLGTPDILLNDSLATQGNASLALQLLGSRPHLVWYLPSLADTAPGDTGNRSFADLVPAGWYWALLQLGVAAGLAALWRARRLGPLVTERLPTAIRASEATEGRARLYRRAAARDRAAEALRAAARSRLAPLVGVRPSLAHSPQTLCPAVAAHLPQPPTDLELLLFGPEPEDDRALVRLADELDGLEARITSGTPAGTPSGSTNRQDAFRQDPSPPPGETSSSGSASPPTRKGPHS